MRYVLDYKTNCGGDLLDVGEAQGRLERLHEELAGYCEGDISYNRLAKVSLDISLALVTDDSVCPGFTDLCYEPGPNGTLVLPLELSHHGVGPDLPDVLGMLDSYMSHLDSLRGEFWFYRLGQPGEVQVELTLVTTDPLLAKKFGFRQEGGGGRVKGREDERIYLTERQD